MRTATFLVLCLVYACASASPAQKIAHPISIYDSYTIISKSSSQRIMVIELHVDGEMKADQSIYPLINWPGVTQSVLFVNMVRDREHVSILKWHLTNINGVTWLAVNGRKIVVGDILKFAILSSVDQPDGFFVGAKVGIPGMAGVEDFSGCVKVSDGIPYAMQYNSGVTMSAIQEPGHGFHGWCFRYKITPGQSKKYLHYFAASSARSWNDVANWYRINFDLAASRPSKEVMKIVNQLNLEDSALSDFEKFQRVSIWMKNYFRYSGMGVGAHIPMPFDWAIHGKSGDCKTLSLVMIQLLRAAHVRAHIVLLGSDNPWPFLQTSASLSDVDHVAVYAPSVKQFFDPSVGRERDLEGHQVMDVETGRIMTVPFTRQQSAPIGN